MANALKGDFSQHMSHFTDCRCSTKHKLVFDEDMFISQLNRARCGLAQAQARRISETPAAVNENRLASKCSLESFVQRNLQR